MRALAHSCATGGRGDVVRDAVSYNVPVWQCQNSSCHVYFAVVNGGASDPSGTTETP